MKKYKVTMHYVNGTYSYEETTNETYDQMVEKYSNGLQKDTINVVGDPKMKVVVNTKNVILITIEEM